MWFVKTNYGIVFVNPDGLLVKLRSEQDLNGILKYKQNISMSKLSFAKILKSIMFDWFVKYIHHHTVSVLLALWSQYWMKRRM